MRPRLMTPPTYIIPSMQRDDGRTEVSTLSPLGTRDRENGTDEFAWLVDRTDYLSLFLLARGGTIDSLGGSCT